MALALSASLDKTFPSFLHRFIPCDLKMAPMYANLIISEDLFELYSEVNQAKMTVNDTTVSALLLRSYLHQPAHVCGSLTCLTWCMSTCHCQTFTHDTH